MEVANVALVAAAYHASRTEGIARRSVIHVADERSSTKNAMKVSRGHQVAVL